MEDSRLSELLLLWLLAMLAFVVVRGRRKTEGTGLVLAYLVNLWIIHWVAPALYLIPGYQNNDLRIVEAGLEQSVYAVIAFVIGSLIIAPFLRGCGIAPKAIGTHNPDQYLPKAYVWTGVVFYMLLSTALGSMPTATAIIATGQQLIIVGISLCCWKAWREKRRGVLAAWLALSLLMPFATIVTRGFIGYGAAATFSVLVFASTFVRSRFVVAVVALVLGYVGLSVYVSYMRDRGEIREVVWGGQSFSDRVDRVSATFGKLEWLDLSNREHLDRIDNRLDQSALVGAAVTRLSDLGGYAHGETFWEALLALIPRAIWPDKPIQAGSGNIVSQYTGVQYSAGTSVGVGHVMECYINFGTLGVVVGFLILGAIVTVLDLQAAERLGTNDLHGFVLWYLPGLSFLQVGGSFVEVTSSAAASIFVALMANKVLDRLQKEEKQAQAPRMYARLSGFRV
jgi:hypothetical protein